MPILAQSALSANPAAQTSLHVGVIRQEAVGEFADGVRIEDVPTTIRPSSAGPKYASIDQRLLDDPE
jgi:hypothetical protein